MPIFGETLIGSDFDMGPGGKGSNQAVGTARMGAESNFVAIIGEDKLGEIATEMYAPRAWTSPTWSASPSMATGVGFIILNQAGENGIILDMSANKLMDAAFVDRAEAQIARSQIVMAVLEIPVPAASRAMELGRRHGVRTLLNPAPAALRSTTRCWPTATIVTPNETELRILMGLSPDDPTPTVDLACRLHGRGPQTVIVTMGEQRRPGAGRGRGAGCRARPAASKSSTRPVPAMRSARGWPWR